MRYPRSEDQPQRLSKFKSKGIEKISGRYVFLPSFLLPFLPELFKNSVMTPAPFFW